MYCVGSQQSWLSMPHSMSVSHTFKNYSAAPAIEEETSKPKLDRAVSFFYDRDSLSPLAPPLFTDLSTLL